MEARRASRAAAVLVNLFLWPGAGHLAVGRRLMAWVWIAATWALVGLALVWPPLVILMVVGRVGAALDTGLGPLRPERASTKAVAVVVALAMIGLVGLPVRFWVIDMFKIPSGSMAPTLVAGDHILVNKLSYRLGAPARGDLVAFRSPCGQKTFVKRVVGLPGDTVEIRCDLLYVNGKAAPAVLQATREGWFERDESFPSERPTSSRYRETLGETSYSIYSITARPQRDRERRAHPDQPAANLAGRGDFPGQTAPDCRHGFHAVTDYTVAVPPRGRIEGASAAPAGCAPFRHYVVPAGAMFVLGDNRDDSEDSRFYGAVPLGNLIGRVSGIWFSSTSQSGIEWHRLGRVH